MTERSCAALISKVECHISDMLCATVRCSVNRYSDHSVFGPCAVTVHTRPDTFLCGDEKLSGMA